LSRSAEIHGLAVDRTAALASAARGIIASMKLDLLAISAHPDDVELTCGGTLIKAARRGYATGILDLTRGEMGTRGTPEIRHRESQRAAKILGTKLRENAGLPDAGLTGSQEQRLVVAEHIRRLRPHAVILPYWEGRHPDHYTAGRLGYEACFLAGLKQLPIPGEPWRPFKLLYTTFDYPLRPSFVVDITREYDRRQRAVLAYRSQFRPRKRERGSKIHIPLDELDTRVGLVARYFGQMIGVRYGEGFLVREMMEVDDVVKMPVRSV
jgi:N-acetylglucosamine malate deacetylase 1